MQHGCLGCMRIEEHACKLHDGRTVCDACSELHDEREAANICRIPDKRERADELLKIEIKRGKRAADRIRHKVTLLWPSRERL